MKMFISFIALSVCGLILSVQGCSLQADSVALDNLVINFWKGNDDLFVTAAVNNYNANQFNASFYDWFTQYADPSINVVALELGVNVVGFNAAEAAFYAVSQVNKGEFHTISPLVKSCLDSNVIQIVHRDISLARYGPNLVQFLGEKVFTIVKQGNNLKITFLQLKIFGFGLSGPLQNWRVPY